MDLVAAQVVVVEPVDLGNCFKIGVMKKYLLTIAFIFTSLGLVQAQFLKVPVGKKYKVVTQTDNTIEVTMLDQHQEVSNHSAIYHDLELKAVTNTGYTLELTPRRIKMEMNMMGMEQKMDTDSATAMQAPELAAIQEVLNKPISIVMDSNKLVSKTQIKQLPAIIDNLDDANRFFLLIAASNMVQGYQWADSTVNPNLRVVNHYTVMAVSATVVELNVTTNTKINTVNKMQDIEIKQSMNGYATAKRWYNRTNGLLMKEESTTNMTGTTETPETSSPMSLKLVLKLVVEQ